MRLLPVTLVGDLVYTTMADTGRHVVKLESVAGASCDGMVGTRAVARHANGAQQCPPFPIQGQTATEHIDAPHALADERVVDLSALPTTGLIDHSTGRPWHWFFSRERCVLPEPFAFVTDDPEAECDAVLSGVAFGQLPDYLAQQHAQAKRLVRVLEIDAPAPWDIYVYRPQRGPVPKRVRLVFDAIADALKQDETLPEKA